jgi:hypothetical protein
MASACCSVLAVPPTVSTTMSKPSLSSHVRFVVDRCASRPCGGGVGLVVVAVGGDDLGSGGAGGEHRHEADAAAAEDEHLLSQAQVHDVQAVGGDGERLCEGPGLEVHGVRQAVGCRQDDDELGRPPGWFSADKKVARADVSQWPERQYSQAWQDLIGSMATRSPILQPVTPSPSSAISPAISWPGGTLAAAGNAPS